MPTLSLALRDDNGGGGSGKPMLDSESPVAMLSSLWFCDDWRDSCPIDSTTDGIPSKPEA